MIGRKIGEGGAGLGSGGARVGEAVTVRAVIVSVGAVGLGAGWQAVRRRTEAISKGTKLTRNFFSSPKRRTSAIRRSVIV